MAKADWCKVSPASGEEGLTEISISADPFTGREARTTDVTLTAAGSTGSGSLTIPVTQKAKPEFIEILAPQDGSDIGVGMSIMLKVKSNCARLGVRAGQSLSSGGFFTPYTFWMYDLTTVFAGTGSEESGLKFPVTGKNGDSSIELDCGTTGKETEFTVLIPFSSIPNPNSAKRYIQVGVFNEDESVYQTILLSQAAGTPSISADPGSVSLEQDGASETVEVNSNAAWSAS
jgi:hypothetical protein